MSHTASINYRLLLTRTFLAAAMLLIVAVLGWQGITSHGKVPWACDLPVGRHRGHDRGGLDRCLIHELHRHHAG